MKTQLDNHTIVAYTNGRGVKPADYAEDVADMWKRATATLTGTKGDTITVTITLEIRKI